MDRGELLETVKRNPSTTQTANAFRRALGLQEKRKREPKVRERRKA